MGGATLEAVESDIDKIGRHTKDQRHGHGTHRDERYVTVFKQVENFVIEPRRMAEFNGVSMALRQLPEEFVQAVVIFAQHRRQLPENGPEMFLEWRDTLKENGYRLRLDVQLFHLGNEAASFHGINKAARSGIVPSPY